MKARRVATAAFLTLGLMFGGVYGETTPVAAHTAETTDPKSPRKCHPVKDKNCKPERKCRYGPITEFCRRRPPEQASMVAVEPPAATVASADTLEMAGSDGNKQFRKRNANRRQKSKCSRQKCASK